MRQRQRNRERKRSIQGWNTSRRGTSRRGVTHLVWSRPRVVAMARMVLLCSYYGNGRRGTGNWRRATATVMGNTITGTIANESEYTAVCRYTVGSVYNSVYNGVYNSVASCRTGFGKELRSSCTSCSATAHPTSLSVRLGRFRGLTQGESAWEQENGESGRGERETGRDRDGTIRLFV